MVSWALGVDSRIKILDVGISLLQTNLKSRQLKLLSDVMLVDTMLLIKIEAPIIVHLRDYASNLEKYKVVRISPVWEDRN